MPQPFDSRSGLGRLWVRVADLERSLAFYTGAVGLEVTGREGASTAFLGVGGYHYHLALSPSVGEATADDDTGHLRAVRLGIRYPDRGSLADALVRLKAAQVGIEAARDEGSSETIVVRDPDGNRLELYWDRPLPEQTGDHSAAGSPASRRLDLDALRAEASRSPGHASAGPADAPLLDEAGRRQLGELRAHLLHLHKVLLEDTRAAYELDRGRVGTNANLLQLLINDPWFAWLRAVSELVVRIDELVEDRRSSSSDAVSMVTQVERLLTASETGEGFARRYYDALQRQPAVVLAHAEVRRALKRMR